MAGLCAATPFADDRVPAPRVRPEAQGIYKHHQGTIQNVMLEVEGKSYFGNSSKAYKKPKDQILENVKRMRQIQKSCRARIQDSESKEPEPVKALWRSAKYSNVPSKVAQTLAMNYNQPRRPASARPSSGVPADEVIAKTQGPNQKHSRRPNSARPASHDRPESVPPLNNLDDNIAVTGTQVPKSFIRINALAASHAPVRRSPSATALIETQQRAEEEFRHTYHRGHVPEYLAERKKQWKLEEEERIRNMPDPDQPPGHRMLPNEERKATLEKLQEKERELTNQLLRLPLRIDTPRIVRHKNEIETQLSQIDEAIRVFSRNKVFVKCD